MFLMLSADAVEKMDMNDHNSNISAEQVLILKDLEQIMTVERLMR